MLPCARPWGLRLGRESQLPTGEPLTTNGIACRGNTVGEREPGDAIGSDWDRAGETKTSTRGADATRGSESVAPYSSRSSSLPPSPRPCSLLYAVLILRWASFWQLRAKDMSTLPQTATTTPINVSVVASVGNRAASQPCVIAVSRCNLSVRPLHVTSFHATALSSTATLCGPSMRYTPSRPFLFIRWASLKTTNCY